MNIVDVLIILGILLFGVSGMKRGGIRQIVGTVGFIIVLMLAFYLKNPLAEFLSLHLPFFKFGGVYHGVTALNILLVSFYFSSHSFIIPCFKVNVFRKKHLITVSDALIKTKNN